MHPLECINPPASQGGAHQHLPWGGILGDTGRKQSLKTPRLETLGLGLCPIMRYNGVVQGVAFQHILFQGNAVVRSKGNDRWLSSGT